jgi:hypothetical protein
MFAQVFLCLPIRGNIVAETQFASREAEMFPIKFRNISCLPSAIFVAETLFPIAQLGKHGKTLAGNNVSATMFPSLPRALLV